MIADLDSTSTSTSTSTEARLLACSLAGLLISCPEYLLSLQFIRCMVPFIRRVARW